MSDKKSEALARIARDLPKLAAAAKFLRNPLLDAALQMAAQELQHQIAHEHGDRELANDDKAPLPRRVDTKDEDAPVRRGQEGL